MINRSQHFENKHIVITGGSGFMGANLSRNLVNQGARIYSFVRKTSDLWRLQGLEKNLNIVEIDVLDREAVRSTLHSIKPHYLFHFAIPPHSELKGPDALAHQIDITTRNLTHLAEAVRGQSYLRCMVHACSSAIYQWSENAFRLSENSPIGATTMRGQLKLNERNLCLDYINKYQLPIKLARIFRAYGPWENDQKLIGKALHAAKTGDAITVGSDQYKRDYIHIDDLIDGMLALASEPSFAVSEVNFGSGQDYSASEIVGLIEEILGVIINRSAVPYQKNNFDQGRYVADINLAAKALNWTPKLTMKEGLASTIQWYHQNQPSH